MFKTYFTIFYIDTLHTFCTSKSLLYPATPDHNTDNVFKKPTINNKGKHGKEILPSSDWFTDVIDDRLPITPSHALLDDDGFQLPRRARQKRAT